MRKKSIALGIAVLGVLVTAALDPLTSKARVPQDVPAEAVDTLTGIVLIDSLRVLSYIDSAGVERPADSSLVPPELLSGAREFRIVMRRNQALASK